MAPVPSKKGASPSSTPRHSLGARASVPLPTHHNGGFFYLKIRAFIWIKDKIYFKKKYGPGETPGPVTGL
jgi:hypothetical protein